MEHIAVATGHRARFAIRNGLATALLSSLSLFTPCDAGAEVSVGEPQVNSVAAPPNSLYVNDSDFPYELRKIVSGQLVLPWSIAFLPDGRMLVTERPGRLRVIEGDHMLRRIDQRRPRGYRRRPFGPSRCSRRQGLSEYAPLIPFLHAWVTGILDDPYCPRPARRNGIDRQAGYFRKPALDKRH